MIGWIMSLENQLFAFKNFYKDLSISEGCPDTIFDDIKLSKNGKAKK